MILLLLDANTTEFDISVDLSKGIFYKDLQKTRKLALVFAL